jgi:DNA-binding MarR family transcriptional regulator
MATSVTRVQALAHITVRMCQAIRQGFPVEGREGIPGGGSRESTFGLFEALVPDFAAAWWVLGLKKPTTITPADDDPEALHDLVNSWWEFFGYYQWRYGVYLTGELDWTRTPWRWPDVPVMPRELLERLETAARKLLPGGIRPPADVPLALDPEDWLVLDHLGTIYPRTILLTDLANAVRLSTRTLGPLVKCLIDRGLAERSQGERKGCAITLRGLEVRKQVK